MPNIADSRRLFAIGTRDETTFAGQLRHGGSWATELSWLAGSSVEIHIQQKEFKPPIFFTRARFKKLFGYTLCFFLELCINLEAIAACQRQLLRLILVSDMAWRGAPNDHERRLHTQRERRRPSTQRYAAARSGTRDSLGRIFAGERIVLIQHAGEQYRLLITRNDRLILQK